MPPVIFRKGLDLKHEVAGVLADSYHSRLVEQIKADGYRFTSGRLFDRPRTGIRLLLRRRSRRGLRLPGPQAVS